MRQTASRSLEKTSSKQLSLSLRSPLVRQLHFWLFRDRNWRWAAVAIVALTSWESFFVQQLLAALLLFTVVFAVVAILAVLFALIVYAVDSALLWSESAGGWIFSVMRHSGPLPAPVRIHRADHAMHRFRRLILS